MRALAVLVCLLIAVLPLLILNGQTLTNALISLTLMAVPIGLCLNTARSSRTPKTQVRSWRLATLLVLVIAAGIVAGLPAARRFQAKFNDRSRLLPASEPVAIHGD